MQLIPGNRVSLVKRHNNREPTPAVLRHGVLVVPVGRGAPQPGLAAHHPLLQQVNLLTAAIAAVIPAVPRPTAVSRPRPGRAPSSPAGSFHTCAVQPAVGSATVCCPHPRLTRRDGVANTVLIKGGSVNIEIC